jgi:Zn-dependent protease with chaperone function
MSPEFVYALNGWPSPVSSDQVRGILAHEVAHSILGHNEKLVKLIAKADFREIANRMLNYEVEADIFSTTKVPKYGRASRDLLVNLVDKCNQKGFSPCTIHRIQSKTHPSTIQRIEYLTHLTQTRFCMRF